MVHNQSLIGWQSFSFILMFIWQYYCREKLGTSRFTVLKGETIEPRASQTDRPKRYAIRPLQFAYVFPAICRISFDYTENSVPPINQSNFRPKPKTVTWSPAIFRPSGSLQCLGCHSLLVKFVFLLTVTVVDFYLTTLSLSAF